MAVLGILLAAGLYGFNQYIQNANGSVCTQQLGDMDRASNTVVAIQNRINPTDPAPTFADMQPYLGNRGVNGGAPNITCPGGGTYTEGGWQAPPINQPNPPTCSLGVAGQFTGTRLHSVTVVP